MSRNLNSIREKLMFSLIIFVSVSSVQFSRSVQSDSLQPHESPNARPPCPSPTPGVYSKPWPSKSVIIQIWNSGKHFIHAFIHSLIHSLHEYFYFFHNKSKTWLFAFDLQNSLLGGCHIVPDNVIRGVWLSISINISQYDLWMLNYVQCFL